jgi:hypothetical protein
MATVAAKLFEVISAIYRNFGLDNYISYGYIIG